MVYVSQSRIEKITKIASCIFAMIVSVVVIVIFISFNVDKPIFEKTSLEIVESESHRESIKKRIDSDDDLREAYLLGQYDYAMGLRHIDIIEDEMVIVSP